MKRSPMPRSTKPIRRTSKPRKRSAGEDLARWVAQQTHCHVCHRRFKSRANVEIHHLLKGRNSRPNFAWNVLLVCNAWHTPRCHELCEGNSRIPKDEGGYWDVISFEVQLTIKRDGDPENWRPEEMQKWMGNRQMPELAPVPDWLLLERTYHDIGR